MKLLCFMSEVSILSLWFLVMIFEWIRIQVMENIRVFELVILVFGKCDLVLL